MFSDVQTNDRDIYSQQQGPRPRAAMARTREDHYLNGTTGRPSYYQCRCGACPDYYDSFPHPKPYRRAIRDNDMLGAGLDGRLGPGYNCLGCPPEQTAEPTLEQRSANAHAAMKKGINIHIPEMSEAAVVMIFLFIVVIFAALLGFKCIADMRREIRSMKQRQIGQSQPEQVSF